MTGHKTFDFRNDLISQLERDRRQAIEEQKKVFFYGPAGAPQFIVSNATNVSNWTKDSLTDTYTYTYKCGHDIRVPATAMVHGQVVPPICPTCHGQAMIDKLEYDNWRENPYWSGYAPNSASVAGSTRIISEQGGMIGWLEGEINRVRRLAWK